MKSSELPPCPCIKEVANFLGISVSMVRKMMKEGPSRKGGLDIRKAGPIRIGSVWRFNREKLLKLLEGEENENN